MKYNRFKIDYDSYPIRGSVLVWLRNKEIGAAEKEEMKKAYNATLEAYPSTLGKVRNPFVFTWASPKDLSPVHF